MLHLPYYNLHALAGTSSTIDQSLIEYTVMVTQKALNYNETQITAIMSKSLLDFCFLLSKYL